MKRSDLKEFHYITHVDNLCSIISDGILCHNLASDKSPVTIASEEVQRKRALKQVPRGKTLHNYANVYFTARNPMLYLLTSRHTELAIIQISTKILDIPGAIIADGNAASSYTAFYPSSEGLERLEYDKIFSEFWTDEDFFKYWEKKRVKCSEVLIPNHIGPEFITGVYVSCSTTEHYVRSLALGIPISIYKYLFFRALKGGA